MSRLKHFSQPFLLAFADKSVTGTISVDVLLGKKPFEHSPGTASSFPRPGVCGVEKDAPKEHIDSGIAAAIGYLYVISAMNKNQHDAGWIPSVGWINYWLDRLGMAGMYEHLASYGICSDSAIGFANGDVMLLPNAVAEARDHKLSLRRVKLPITGRIESIEKCINLEMPVILHLAKYKSMLKSDDGVIVLPAPITYDDPEDEQDAFCGEVSYCVVEYNKGLQLFTLAAVGKYLYLPYYYVANPKLCVGATVFGASEII